MQQQMRAAMVFLFLSMPLALASCGGGGGGGSGSGTGSNLLVFTPTTLEADLDDSDESTTISIAARLTRALTGEVYVYIVDTSGLLRTDVEFYEQSEFNYRVDLHTTESAPPGTYSGELLIKLCKTYNCSEQHPGSPVKLPYVFTVTSATNLTPIEPVAGVAEWLTEQGNTAHTGYVPATFNVSEFSSRWRVPKYSLSQKSAPVISGGRVIYLSADPYETYSRIYALSENDGSYVWEKILLADVLVESTAIPHLTHPSAKDGLVYLSTGGFGNVLYRYIWGFDIGTGDKDVEIGVPETPIAGAPTLVGDSLYIGSGSVYRSYDLASESLNWSSGSGGSWRDQESLAYGDGSIYGLNGYPVVSLVSTDAADGTLNFQVDTEFSISGRSSSAMYVADTGQVAAVAGYYGNGPLIMFDVEAEAVAWSSDLYFGARPATDGEYLYVANLETDTLEALNLTDGSVAWSWTAPEGEQLSESANLVVTDNLVFVSGDAKTYAISLSAGHQAVWSYGRAASHLAITANGILIIMTADGGVSAINLH